MTRTLDIWWDGRPAGIFRSTRRAYPFRDSALFEAPMSWLWDSDRLCEGLAAESLRFGLRFGLRCERPDHPQRTHPQRMLDAPRALP